MLTHNPASVTVTVYEPAPIPARSSLEVPLDQLKVYPVVPPATVKLIDPSDAAAQSASVGRVVKVIAAGTLIRTLSVAVQVLASVTTTV